MVLISTAGVCSRAALVAILSAGLAVPVRQRGLVATGGGLGMGGVPFRQRQPFAAVAFEHGADHQVEEEPDAR